MKHILLIFMLISTLNLISPNEIIIDSDMIFEEAIKGTKAPKEVIDNLVLMNIEYYSTDNKLHRGQLVVHKEAVEDLKIIFTKIKEIKFPIHKMVPIVKYNWSDDASMNDNNTSAFCYRNIAGTNRLSNHSFGLAVDINPFFNPVIYKDGKVSPAKAKYNINKAGTLHKDSEIVKLFKELGWRWGGEFSKYADNHHFDKEINK